MVEASQIGALMADIGPAMQLGEVRAYEGDGRWALIVDEERIVFAEHDDEEGRLWLSAEVGRPPGPGRAETIERLMQFNGAWREAGGYRLALDAPGEGVVLACDLYANGLTVERLRVALSNFLEALAPWRQVVATGPAGLPSELPTSIPMIRV